MVEELQRLYKINIAGPTTTAALPQRPSDGVQDSGDTEALKRGMGRTWSRKDRIRQIQNRT